PVALRRAEAALTRGYADSRRGGARIRGFRPAGPRRRGMEVHQPSAGRRGTVPRAPDSAGELRQAAFALAANRCSALGVRRRPLARRSLVPDGAATRLWLWTDAGFWPA